MSMNFAPVIDAVKSTRPIIFDKALASSVKMKGEADFVTEVDLRISEHLKRQLGALHPEIGFMSEEEEPGELARRRWILDPIDGTTNLVFGYNMSSVSLALVEDERPVFGVVYNPFADEVFCAEAGRGATLNGAPIAVVDRPVDGCLIEFGAGSTRKHEADEAFDVAKNVFKHCLDLRRICSSALAICFVACGRINGYFEKRLKPWDYAAACLILAEAGGQSSSWDGAPMQYAAPQSIVCGSPKAYAFLQEAVAAK